ncbi:universal stress protein [Solirubrobacter ginsenosidimutans]|uniref:Universal stress protein n=1 Tax=Solirubrobacter ginsenosidimutans TaxID=490573 RepID=A0A9X3MYN9_9ACTN|nr:universal stress protein [Solirubrobacter ginsenosidimutans]MDA0164967.1 universal stress protein [Solirubrobacter ginsenosidimutans]
MHAPIVAAYDPYQEDRAPVELALALGELTGARVIAVAVSVFDGFTDPDDVNAGVNRPVTATMERLLQETGAEAQIENDESVSRALQTVVEDVDAGLIVVGSTGRGVAGRVLPGSTAERLLHGAPCPVALAPHGYRQTPIQTVAVGFVDTPEGHAALAAAHQLSARAGARLRVVMALRPPGWFNAVTAPGEPRLRGSDLEGRRRSEIEDALNRALCGLGPDVDVESEFHVDDPADVLLNVSGHVDLLVCGSRGYGPLRSVLLGGVSRRLVDGAHCPVLVLPRQAKHPLEDLVRGVAKRLVAVS